MEYSNPELPENVNTTETNPFKEFVLLTSGLLMIAFIVVSLLIFIIDNFADKIPFELEQKLPISGFFETEKFEALPEYLAQLSQKIIKNFNLPESMNVTIHYANDATVNAYATLGGHIILYRGLIEKLRYEDELAMVIGHEVAHIKYRHPILSMSHGVVVAVVVSAISSSVGDSIASDLIGSTGLASLMRFARKYEYQSDKEAIRNLINIYGHAAGALGLFKVFEEQFKNDISVEFLATHPLTQNRIANTNKIIEEYNISGRQEMTEYPEKFKLWLQQQKEKERKSKNSGNSKKTP